MNALFSTTAFATAVAVPLPAAASKVDDDPIFAAIDAYESEADAWWSYKTPNDEDIPDDVSARYHNALEVFLASSPSTPLGTAAFLRAVEKAAANHDDAGYASLFSGWAYSESGRTLLSRAAAAIEQSPVVEHDLPVTPSDFGGDEKLRALWVAYQDQMAVYETKRKAHEKARARFESRYPDPLDGNEWKSEAVLAWRRETGSVVAYDEWNAAGEQVDRTIRAIRRAKAETLFGVAVKLAAITPHWDDVDLRQSIYSALRSAERLTGERFTRQASIVLSDEI